VSETTLLYALSTLAQTCAALVAFVGALGLYRLQSLTYRGQEAERNLRGVAARASQNPGWIKSLPTKELIQQAESWIAGVHPGLDPGSVEDIRKQYEEGLKQWKSVGPGQRRTGRSLVLFVGWNLLVIFLALIGFNFVNTLKDSSLASFGLWILAGGAVLVTVLMMVDMLRSTP